MTLIAVVVLVTPRYACAAARNGCCLHRVQGVRSDVVSAVEWLLQVLRVGPTQQYQSIQSALEAEASGASISIDPGRYEATTWICTLRLCSGRFIFLSIASCIVVAYDRVNTLCVALPSQSTKPHSTCRGNEQYTNDAHVAGIHQHVSDNVASKKLTPI